MANFAEYRIKFKLRNKDYWEQVPMTLQWKDFNFKIFDLRIDRNKIYHSAETPGCKEDYEEAMCWMRIAK